MSELTNIHARAAKDLTTPANSPADPNALDQVKLVAGNFPPEYAGNEALTVKQLKDLAAAGRKEELDTINLKIDKEVNNLESKKANKTDVDVALSNLSTTANKFYPTLAEANYYSTTMAVNDVVTVGEEANRGLWYKATAGATSLTKSPYDPLTQAKDYVSRTGEASIVGGNLTNINYTTADKKLTFSGTVYVFTGTNMYQLQTPQSIDLPNFSPYRLEYIIASNTVIAKPYTQAKTEGNIVVGFMTASATGLKTLDFAFAQDGIAQDALDLAKKYADENSARYTSVNVATNPVITDALSKFQILTFWGTLTKDTEVIFPKHTANYVLQNSVTLAGFKLTVKTEGQTTPAIEFPAASRKVVFNTGTALFDVGNDKADLKSPAFTGSPKAPNASVLTEDDTIATTKFVKDALRYADAALISLNVSNAVNSELVITDTQFQRNLFIVSGTLTSDITIVIPSTLRKQIWVQKSTNGQFDLKIKTDSQTSAAATLSGGGNHVYSFGSGCYVAYSGKADISSPSFLGNPKAPTPQYESNDQSIATTHFVRNASRAVRDFTISDVTEDIPDLGCSVIRLVGDLTAKKSLKFDLPSGQGQWIVLNHTNHIIELRGIGQVSDIVTLAVNEAADVYVRASVIRRLPYAQSGGSSTLPIAEPSKLGGIKVGSGLTIAADGTLSASKQSALSLQYAGKFKQGSDYQAGQTIEHGSGIYEVKTDVENADTPFQNGDFNKIQHNLYAGYNGSVDVLSVNHEDVAALSLRPTYMSKDGLICFNNSTQTLKISYDFGKTWPHIIYDAGSGSWLRWTKELDDGELLISTTSVDSDRPYINKVLKSTGWNKGKNLTPTWEVVKEIQKEGVIYSGAWGISSYRNYALLAEYGAKNFKDSGTFTEDYARYCYLSKDYGKTWEQIFDLGSVTDGVGVHLHGVAFDEYWNRIWLSHGDGSYGRNGLFYSDDFGKTWVSGLEFYNDGPNFPQSVAITPMPTCILLASDSYPNGMQRIDRAQGRIPYKGFYNIEIGYAIPDQAERLNHIIKGVYKAEWLPNSPVIFVWSAETMLGKSGCALTWDGWTFHEIFVGPNNSEPSFGAETVIGPTRENTIIVSGNEKINGSTVSYKKTIKVSLE